MKPGEGGSTNALCVFARKMVVRNVKNPPTEISLEEARRHDTNAKLDSFVDIFRETPPLGKVAAQAAKQIIEHKVIEASREEEKKQGFKESPVKAPTPANVKPIPQPRDHVKRIEKAVPRAQQPCGSVEHHLELGQRHIREELWSSACVQYRAALEKACRAACECHDRRTYDRRTGCHLLAKRLKEIGVVTEKEKEMISNTYALLSEGVHGHVDESAARPALAAAPELVSLLRQRRPCPNPANCSYCSNE